LLLSLRLPPLPPYLPWPLSPPTEGENVYDDDDDDDDDDGDDDRDYSLQI
jgi:hypothetical protein